MNFVIARVPASGKFAMTLESPMRDMSGSIQEPVQVNHSELLASPRPSQESRLNKYGDVRARRGGGRKKDPQTWFVVR
jgi:hypothetical protein